jgi:hypothetical protein
LNESNINTTHIGRQQVSIINFKEMTMDVKEAALCLYHVMQAFGVRNGKSIRALLGIYNISVHDVAKRADVSPQFVGQWLAGRRSSEKVNEAVKEMLFGKGITVDLNL